MDTIFWLIFGFIALLFVAIPTTFVLIFISARKRGRRPANARHGSGSDGGASFSLHGSSSDCGGSSDSGGSCGDGGGGGGGD